MVINTVSSSRRDREVITPNHKINLQFMISINFYYNKDLRDVAERLRREATKAERLLWNEVLKNGNIQGYAFLRQRPVLDIIADFLCKELMLIIEVDGYSRKGVEKWQLDKKRQKELKKVGFTVLRFTDEEVLGDIRNVQRAIELWAEDHPLKIFRNCITT